MGIVHESEHFFRKPTPTNPSGKWTNYTDGSCQRLILQTGYDATRYLLGCDAVDCCTEDDTAGPIEYQIPNVHPSWLAKVESAGTADVTLFDNTVIKDCDVWSWKFTIENFTVYTKTDESSNSTALVQWDVHIEGDDISNQYKDYTAIPDSEQSAFALNFQEPPVCQDPRTLSCDDAHAKGLLSDESLAFVKAGSKRTAVRAFVRSLNN